MKSLPLTDPDQMASLLPPCAFSLVFCLFLASSPSPLSSARIINDDASPSSSPTPSELVKKACNWYTNASFCLQTLASYPPVNKAKTPEDLALETINLALNEALKVVQFIGNTQPSPRGYDKCLVEYGEMANVLKSSLRDVGRIPKETLLRNLMNLRNPSVACLTAIGGRISNPPSRRLRRRTHMMMAYADLAVAATMALPA